MQSLDDVCHLACFSETSCPEIFEYAVMQVKDKLLEARSLKNCYCCWCLGIQNSKLLSGNRDEEWKTSRGHVGAMQPKFCPEPDMSTMREPVLPALKLCSMNDAGHLTIPQAERQKWLNDPVRRDLARKDFFMFSFRGIKGAELFFHAVNCFI